MGQIDEAKEWRRLEELYASLEEGELEEIAAGADFLTAIAREALRMELRSRGMASPAEKSKVSAAAERKENYAAEASAPSETLVRGRDGTEPVMISRYRDLPEALVAKSMLDSAGIESYLGNENLVRLHWLISNLTGGIRLMVRAEDAETARKLLEEQIPEKIDVAGVGEYQQPRCPQCGSLDTGFDELDKHGAEVAMAFLGVPFAVTRKGGKCHACGHEWDFESELSPD
jgi:hypothetical protein